MEQRFHNNQGRRNEDPFEHILNFHSDRSLFTEERCLTSTGRRRASIIQIDDDNDQNETQLQSNQDDDITQGLPKEMIDKIKRMKMGKSGKDCTICYNGFKPGEKIRKLPCKHIFHDSCILPWLEKNITCPNCRLNLFEYFLDNPEGNYN